jgi:predicted dienelactone hydrolase
MKKVLKIMGIIILVPIVLIIILLICLSFKKSVPSKYWQKVETGGAIEEKYSKLGEYKVDSKRYDAPKAAEEPGKEKFFDVWYPKEKGTYPLIVMINGTGVTCDKYDDVFKHIASFGYVVIGNNYESNWNGKHPSETLDFALNTEEIANMIDREKIAVGGHSQSVLQIRNWGLH